MAADVVPAVAPPAAPTVGTCPRCADEIVTVVLAGGGDVALDRVEILPLHECPTCHQVDLMGHARSRCLRCHDTRLLGEPVPDLGVVLVDVRGVGRPYRGSRQQDEAFHRIHRCGGS